MVAHQNAPAVARNIFNAANFDLEIFFVKKAKKRLPARKSLERVSELVGLVLVPFIINRIAFGKSFNWIFHSQSFQCQLL